MDVDVPTISASHAPATGREARRTPSLARIASTGFRCVAHDVGIGVVQVVLAGRLDIGTALQADRALRVARAALTWSFSICARCSSSGAPLRVWP
jgi:hypothetical protein